MYHDLCTNGPSLYRETIAGFCVKLVHSERLAMLTKPDEEACLTLFGKANEAMSNLLVTNVANFD